jgi:inner membrane protein
MLFFGHIGIAVGAVFLIYLFFRGIADYRFVIMGSMLPDIIDKPIGVFNILGSTFDSGRALSHTLLFILIITLLSVYFLRSNRLAWFKFLAVASVIHVLLDEMWKYPKIFLWPLYGIDFGSKISTVGSSGISAGTHYVINVIKTSSDNLFVYETELFGLAILALFVFYYKLYVPGNFKEFVFHGRLYQR